MQECRISAEVVAERIGIEPRQVYRHLAGEAYPQKPKITAYEKLFSASLRRPIRLNEKTEKRHRKDSAQVIVKTDGSAPR